MNDDPVSASDDAGRASKPWGPLKRYVDARLSERGFTISELADAMHVSKQTLYDAMKSEGRPPSSFVLNRLALALTLLSSPPDAKKPDAETRKSQVEALKGLLEKCGDAADTHADLVSTVMSVAGQPLPPAGVDARWRAVLAAQPQDRFLRVGWYEWPGVATLASDGNCIGPAIDRTNDVMMLLGVRPRYEQLQIPEVRRAVECGAVDLLACQYIRVPARLGTVAFSAPAFRVVSANAVVGRARLAQLLRERGAECRGDIVSKVEQQGLGPLPATITGLLRSGAVHVDLRCVDSPVGEMLLRLMCRRLEISEPTPLKFLRSIPEGIRWALDDDVKSGDDDGEPGPSSSGQNQPLRLFCTDTYTCDAARGQNVGPVRAATLLSEPENATFPRFDVCFAALPSEPTLLAAVNLALGALGPLPPLHGNQGSGLT